MVCYKFLALLFCLVVLAGCSGAKKKTALPPPVAGRGPAVAPAGPAGTPAELSPIKRNILFLARREWDYFGRQTVVFDGDEESIPHVGKWEDDEEPYVYRVNWYWRAVGKPHLNGKDCSEPWSAAFISWIMKEAGVPEEQFMPADAHWHYLTRIMAEAGAPGSAFVPHSIDSYSPQLGDLICATRDSNDPPPDGFTLGSYLLEHTKLHCDIVVERDGQVLAVIGGNVRNSVSKTFITLNKDGLVQPNRRRPWFLVLENRL